jgi:hypothetical protein
MIAELNKIAIVHLFLLGFEDELTNFTLGLHNPSKQSDLLGIELWKEKILLYKDAVSEIPNTVAPVSASWAKKHILGFSDDEIRLDIQQQRVERAVSAELGKTAEVITKTGIFDTIDKLYGKKEGDSPAEGEEGTEESGALPGGDLGGGSFSEPSMSEPAPEGGEPAEITPESFMKNDLNMLLEENLFGKSDYMDLSKGRNSLMEIDDKLKTLLNKEYL